MGREVREEEEEEDGVGGGGEVFTYSQLFGFFLGGVGGDLGCFEGELGDGAGCHCGVLLSCLEGFVKVCFVFFRVLLLSGKWIPYTKGKLGIYEVRRCL